jgi:hypothetical protein
MRRPVRLYSVRRLPTEFYDRADLQPGELTALWPASREARALTRALRAEAAGLTETLGEGAMVIASSTGAAMQMNAPQLDGELAKLATLSYWSVPDGA